MRYKFYKSFAPPQLGSGWVPVNISENEFRSAAAVVECSGRELKDFFSRAIWTACNELRLETDPKPWRGWHNEVTRQRLHINSNLVRKVFAQTGESKAGAGSWRAAACSLVGEPGFGWIGVNISRKYDLTDAAASLDHIGMPLGRFLTLAVRNAVAILSAELGVAPEQARRMPPRFRRAIAVLQRTLHSSQMGEGRDLDAEYFWRSGDKVAAPEWAHLKLPALAACPERVVLRD